MKELELLKCDLFFTSWGELYLGCKANWLTAKDVIWLCEQKRIKQVSENDYLSLYLALDDSYYQFLEQLKSLLVQSEQITIKKNEDELSDDLFNYIPSKFFKIWELEFLLEIKNSTLSRSDKLNEVALLFDKMNYPEEWKTFLFYQPQKNDVCADEVTLYQNLIDYVEKQKEYYK